MKNIQLFLDAFVLALLVLIHLYRPGENLWCHDVTQYKSYFFNFFIYFCSFRSFRWFRFGRFARFACFGRFGGFVSLVSVVSFRPFRFVVSGSVQTSSNNFLNPKLFFPLRTRNVPTEFTLFFNADKVT